MIVHRSYVEAVPEKAWFKSSYSTGDGGECVEVAVPEPAWCKSSYSGAEGGQCVEVATTPAAILVRDSKVTTGPVVGIGAAAWVRFVTSLDVGR
ncbi:DUF397 domain-containing protein [Streptomyces sp. NBC_00237]|uniref:DUF397 domain-containing protein n=1 Tax=Streptomyces sp. NBC_00237 TaxID=2975687 RepID=UPI00224F7B68|nr:DUF397 domain-containing protein [Streptomyces sp. NBC_00237]MCX5204208.1 DUF397 domain-containing protein [Streptomyces sp. NBC_00237]